VQVGNIDGICLAKTRLEDSSLLQNHIKTAVYKLGRTAAVIDINGNRPATPVEAELNGITQTSSDLAKEILRPSAEKAKTAVDAAIEAIER
jgi:hypothetical protein